MVARVGRSDPRHVRRLQGSAGQTTVEWLVIMVGLVALAGVLAGAGIWQGVATKLASAVGDLIDAVKDKAP